MNISSVSDSDLRVEWNRRFFLHPGDQLNAAKDAAEHLRTLFSQAARDQEHFAIILLNQQNRIIESRILFTGSLSTSAVYPREIVKLVLKHESSSILVGHSHPSGAVKPSSSDKAVTVKIQNALASIDSVLLDHLVLGNGTDGYFSFADNHLL